MDVTQANGMQTHETSRITMQQLSCRCGPGLGYKTTKRGNKRSYEKEEIIMASRSSNQIQIRGSKRAWSTAVRRLQRRLNFQTERICRWLYGKENDRAAGKTDGR